MIEQETGMTLPEGVEIQVLEETSTTRYLVLPAQLETSDELSDGELEAVAGAGYTAVCGNDVGDALGGSWVSQAAAINQDNQQENEMNEQQNPTTNLIAKAMKDETFRQSLLADPRGVIEQETGMTLPEGVEIQVLEETPTTRYLVLPAQLKTNDELSDADLETIAGGVALSGGPGLAVCSTEGTCRGPGC